MASRINYIISRQVLAYNISRDIIKETSNNLTTNESNRKHTNQLEKLLHASGITETVTPVSVPKSSFSLNSKGQKNHRRPPKIDFDLAERISRLLGKRVIWSHFCNPQAAYVAVNSGQYETLDYPEEVTWMNMIILRQFSFISKAKRSARSCIVGIGGPK